MIKKIVVVLVLCLVWAVSITADAERSLVSFLLDETGSMNDSKTEVIDGFNEYISSLKVRKDTMFTLVKFNASEITNVCQKEYIENVRSLNNDTYIPNAMTPLYDAVAELIRQTEKSLGEVKIPVLCVIFTDGLENASKEYKKNDILTLIEKKQSEGWTFVYLGSNQDAWSEGQSIGLYQGNVLDWDGMTTIDCFTTLTDCSTAYLDSNLVNISNTDFFDTNQ